jgi:hypothetical protein
MKQSRDSGLFPLVTLVKGNFFGVLNDARMRGSVLSLQALLNGSKLAESRRNELDDEA